MAQTLTRSSRDAAIFRTVKSINPYPFSIGMESRFEKLLEQYYDDDYYDYREDLMEDIAGMEESAQQVALEARLSHTYPMIESLGHQLDSSYPDLSIEEIVSALKYLLDGELGGSVIIFGEDVLDKAEYIEGADAVGDKVDSWIEEYMKKKKVSFEIVEIVFVFDQLIRAYRGSEEDDQFILIPEMEAEEEE